MIARNCDWFIALFVPVVIGRSNCFGFGFSTVIRKPLCCNNAFDCNLFFVVTEDECSDMEEDFGDENFIEAESEEGKRYQI